MTLVPRTPSRGPLHWCLGLFLAALGSVAPPAASGQAAEPPAGSITALEAQYEKAFEAALETSDEESVYRLQAWGGVLQAAIILEQARARAAGEDDGAAAALDSAAVVERVLQRWQQLRPEDSGPEVVRAIQIQDPEAKRAAMMALLDRFPDDVLVVSQVSMMLRQSGHNQQTTELFETFLLRNPDRPIAYELLSQNFARMENETRQAEVLRQWAENFPQDPKVISLWMSSPVLRQDAEATARLLDSFFRGRLEGWEALRACQNVLHNGGPAYEAAGRACVARLAADPDPFSELAQAATSALVEMAAADGDWSRVQSTLARLDPEARVRATIAAARQLEVPERCPERIDLLRAVAGVLPAAGGLHRSLAGELKQCKARPAASSLYLDLLRTVAPEQTAELIRGWVPSVNRRWRGELPSGTMQVLEERLAEEGDSLGLYEALDIVYQIEGSEEKRHRLLLGWQERFLAHLDGEQAIALAWGLVEREDLDGAIRALERQIERRFEVSTVELLWGLYLEKGGLEQAERFAAGLIASESSLRRQLGHQLAGRAALYAEDPQSAERHYWQSLTDGDTARPEVAVELLALVTLQGGSERLPGLARQICEQSLLSRNFSDPSECAADLLTRAGSAEAATALRVERAQRMPDDVQSLRKLAETAQSAGQLDLAERARRRILELDPHDESSWTSLGALLETADEHEKLEQLLVEARRTLPAPPLSLLRAVGRSRLAAGRPERAREVFEEARAALPPGADTAWIDSELRQVYTALGRSVPAAAAAGEPAPAPQPVARPAQPAPSGESVAELLAAAEALQSGSGGRYDRKAAAELFERAVDTGDPLAGLRLALLRRLETPQTPESQAAAEDLFQRFAGAVEALAAEGNGYADYLVGTAKLVGLGGRTDYPAARRRLERAAQQGESWAWHNLGWMNETGRGLEQADPEAALEAYRQASRLGNAASMFDLARLSLTPDGSGVPCEEGLSWLERSARTGHLKAAGFLGKLLFYGRGECVAAAPQQARPWLEMAAAAGDTGAQYDLGLALLVGVSPEGDPRRGVSLVNESNRSPDPLSLETLAFVYATGLGTARDPHKARELMAQAARIGSDSLHRLRGGAARYAPFEALILAGVERLERLAAAGDPAAAAWLGALLYQGGGVPADPQRAVALLRQAAEAGEPEAMRSLGHAYRHGNGVEQDRSQGLRWWRRGAEAGDSFSMMYYAQVLLQGEEVDRDLETGLSWLTRAAEAGNWWAIKDLGHVYDEGWYGLPRDEEKAAAWHRILAARGDAEARGWLISHGYPVESSNGGPVR